MRNVVRGRARGRREVCRRVRRARGGSRRRAARNVHGGRLRHADGHSNRRLVLRDRRGHRGRGCENTRSRRRVRGRGRCE
jgi:hypothetical protein